MALMKNSSRAAASGITVRFSAPMRDRIARIAREEHRSAAAYIQQLVERDLQTREEAERVIRLYVAPGLPEAPAGQVAPEEGETTERHEHRSATLDALFGKR
jgi:predicted transcriptional regulator